MNVLATRRGHAPLPVDARGRRGAAADRDRADHRRARPRGATGSACRCRCTPRSTGSSRRRRRATRMRICVVGCGAVGSLFAANLAQLDDVEVWAYDLVARARRRDQRATGCGSPAPARSSGGCARRPTPASSRRATSASSRRRRCTPSAAIAATAHAFAGGCVATVQNGLGNEEAIAAHVERVIRGTTFPAGKIVEPGHVQWDVKGDTTLGPFEPQPAPLAEVERLADACTRGRDADARGRRRARAAVAQGDLQRGDEPDRRAHRADARPRLRAARPAPARHAASSTRARRSPRRRASSSTPTPRS